MKKDALSRPFLPEQIKTRQGQGGKTLSYLETHVVISRLNEACDVWSFEIFHHDVLEDEVVVIGKLTADGVVKMAFGSSAITRDRDGRSVSIGDDAKSASSDSLKKAASLLGVGLHLYSDGALNGTSIPTRAAPREGGGSTPARVPAEERITAKQLGAVQSVARRKNIDRGELAAQLGERFGKVELQHLSKREASAFLSELLEANGSARV